MSRSGKRTFFVERYVPALDAVAATLLSSQLRASVDQLQREGHDVEWLRSFALVEEETYVCLLVATHEDVVASVHERASLSCGHVVEVVAGEPAV